MAGWVLYDLANTIFALNITSVYFSLWIVNDLGGTDGNYGLAFSISMAFVFITAPLIGALSDQARRRMPFLMVSTMVCVSFTWFLGVPRVGVALMLFGFANYFYQSGLIFYDALLPVVSTEANRGRIGGLGVGIGYLGSLLGIAVGAIATSTMGDRDAKPFIFKATAIMFLLFALPCFWFVKEPIKKNTLRGLDALRGAIQELRGAVKLASKYPGLGRFLVGRVFYTDAANTLTVYMSVYVTNDLGFSQKKVELVLLVGIVAAIIGGLSWGWVVDRIGPKRSLNMVLGLWAIDLIAGMLVGMHLLPTSVFWAIAPLAGIALGGTWASDRPLMLRLSPPRYYGLFYGLYNMVGRFSAIFGPLLWGLIVSGLDLGRPAAVGSLVIMIGIAYLILRPVSDHVRLWSPEDLPLVDSEAH